MGKRFAGRVMPTKDAWEFVSWHQRGEGIGRRVGSPGPRVRSGPKVEGVVDQRVQALEERERQKAPPGGAGRGLGVDELGRTAKERRVWASILRGW